MMIANQDCPLVLWLPVALRPACPAHADFRANLGSSERISAGVHRISQDRQNRVIQGRLPINLLIFAVVANRRQSDLFLAKPQQHLASTSALFELLEDQVNRVLHAPVGIDLDRVV